MANDVHIHVSKGRSTVMIIVYVVITIGLGTLVTIMIGMAIRDSKIIKTHSTRDGIILPYIPMPSTLQELAQTYTIISNAPFAETREGFGLRVSTNLYPTLQTNPTRQRERKDMIYDYLCTVVAVANSSIFIACFGLGILAHESLFLIAYLVCFCLWNTWTIGRYPYATFLQKMLLLILLPSMASYFFYRLAVAPVRGLSRATR